MTSSTHSQQQHSKSSLEARLAHPSSNESLHSSNVGGSRVARRMSPAQIARWREPGRCCVRSWTGGQNNTSSSYGHRYQDYADPLTEVLLDALRPNSQSSFTPETIEDWEIQKENIKTLYLQRKMRLVDVVEAMRRDHGFSATQRQYKRKFLTWNWSKYMSKRSREKQLTGTPAERPIGPTTSRRTSRSPQYPFPTANGTTQGRLALAQLHHRFPGVPINLILTGTNDYRAYGLYSGLRDIIHRTSSIDPSWNNRCKVWWLPSHGDHLVSLFVLAARLLDIGESVQSGIIIRQGFRAIDDLLKNDSITIFQSLLLEIPYNLLGSGKYRELSLYANYISQMLEIKKPMQPITQMAQTMCWIVVDKPDTLFHHLERLYEITADIYSNIRGDQDFNSINARMKALTLKGDDQEDHVSQAYENTLETLGALVQSTRNRLGASSTVVLGLEFRQVQAISRLKPTSGEFTSLCDGLLSRFLAGEDHSMFLLTTSDHWTLEQYAVTKYLVHEHHVQEGDIASAIHCLEESREAFECAEAQSVDEEMMTYHAGRALRVRAKLAEVLTQDGKAEEAAEVLQHISKSRYLCGIVQREETELHF